VQWINDHGYKAIVGSHVYCLHYKAPDNWNLKNGISQAIVELKCGLVYSHLFEYMIFYPVFFSIGACNFRLVVLGIIQRDKASHKWSDTGLGNVSAESSL